MARRKEVSAEIFGYGDIDTRGASGRDRLGILDAEERAALSQAKSNGEGAIRQAYTAYQDALLRYKRRRDRREERNKAHEPRILFAQAWRELGVQERYPHQHLHWAGFLAIIAFLGGIDFFIFAQAYAIVEDVEDYSLGWWVGGFIGLVVFGAGLVVARQIKTFIAGHEQRALLREVQNEGDTTRPRYDVRGKEQTLPFSKANILALTLAGVFFGSLVIAAIVIRFEGSRGDVAPIVMTGLLPPLIVAIEVFLYDPLYRLPLKPGRRERKAERHARKKGIQLENVIASYDSFIQKTRAAYAHQRQIAQVKAADLGIEVESAPGVDSSSQTSEWEIRIQDLLKTRTPDGGFDDDLISRAVAQGEAAERP